MSFRVLCLGCAGLALLATAARAEVTLPERQPGLWELVMESAETEGVPAMSMKQCADAATDKVFQEKMTGIGRENCKRYDIKAEGDGFVVDSDCTMGGMHAVGHMVITGDFQTSYTMVLHSTTEGDTPPAEPTMTIKATRLGDCAADMKPGDIILPGGQRMNVLDMGKHSGG